MIKLSKIFFAAFIFFFFTFTLYAEEMWFCEGWSATDDISEGKPFILKGNYEKYYWNYFIGKSQQKITIKKVGENKNSFHDVYISFQGSIQRPYIIQKDNHTESWRGNGFHNQSKSLKLVEFHLDIEKSFTICTKE